MDFREIESSLAVARKKYMMGTNALGRFNKITPQAFKRLFILDKSSQKKYIQTICRWLVETPMESGFIDYIPLEPPLVDLSVKKTNPPRPPGTGSLLLIQGVGKDGRSRTDMVYLDVFVEELDEYERLVRLNLVKKDFSFYKNYKEFLEDLKRGKQLDANRKMETASKKIKRLQYVLSKFKPGVDYDIYLDNDTYLGVVAWSWPFTHEYGGGDSSPWCYSREREHFYRYRCYNDLVFLFNKKTGDFWAGLDLMDGTRSDHVRFWDGSDSELDGHFIKKYVNLWGSFGVEKRVDWVPFKACFFIEDICELAGIFGTHLVIQQFLQNEKGSFKLKYHWLDPGSLAYYLLDELNEYNLGPHKVLILPKDRGPEVPEVPEGSFSVVKTDYGEIRDFVPAITGSVSIYLQELLKNASLSLEASPESLASMYGETWFKDRIRNGLSSEKAVRSFESFMEGQLYGGRLKALFREGISVNVLDDIPQDGFEKTVRFGHLGEVSGLGADSYIQYFGENSTLAKALSDAVYRYFQQVK